MEDQLPKNEQYQFPLLIYDHQCSLCVRFKQSLKKLNLKQEINTVSLHDQKIYELFPILNFEECQKVVHFIKEDAEVLKGEKVIEHLITLNPSIEKFSWLIESKMGQKALNIFYNSMNNYRESLRNRCPSCRNKS